MTETKPLKPREIVEQLDRYIVGQADAKRAVAIAIRNRWRRQQLGDEMRQEVSPKNILMIGSTGVGKTEIARRLAKLTGAPFIKVEASKYTEVGYYGRDVESMVRELLDNAIAMVREAERKKVKTVAEEQTTEKILDLLCKPASASSYTFTAVNDPASTESDAAPPEQSQQRTREKMRAMLDAGNGGSIVNIASTNSFRPQHDQPAYTASKHAVLGLTRSAAIDYGRQGIRINAICPGAIDTPMLRNAIERRGRDADSVAGRLGYVGRFGEPDEIAAAAVWLCSDSSSFTTGHALSVDGGMLAG